MIHPDGSKVNYRQCFEAPDGWLMCSADFSGQELAVMAAMSGDPIMLKVLNEGGDLHSEAAAGMFGIDPKDARQKKPGSDKTYRDYGKIVMFSLAYGKTAEGFAKDWKISKEEAKKIIEGFEKRFAVLAKWLKRQGELGKEQGYSRLSNGAMRFVGEAKRADKDAPKRASSNYQIQGSSSWMTRIAMIMLDEKIRKENLAMELIGCIHDELLVIFKHHENCPTARMYLHLDDEVNTLEKQKKEAADAGDKAAEKAAEAALEKAKAERKARCESECVETDCAHRYESIIGECMTKAGERILEGKVPAGFAVATAKSWVH